jgi:hypothetical protein
MFSNLLSIYLPKKKLNGQTLFFTRQGTFMKQKQNKNKLEEAIELSGLSPPPPIFVFHA